VSQLSDSRLTACLIGVLVCSGFSSGIGAQDSVPAFEVATVKASSAVSPPMSIQALPGGRLEIWNYPLPRLIEWAYGLDEGRLINLPEGFEAVRYDVIAKSPEPEPKRGGMQLMMRGLLAERFKLVIHHESRELVVYTLLTDTGGAKVVVSKTAEPAGPNPFRMTDAGTLIGTRVTADMLANVLSNQLGRPVRNMTEFTGRFDFTLRWAPDAQQEATEIGERPSLLTALREQLGFRLEARRMPTDVVVVDHVERTPTQN
jgi:uncharacterized protein (TIGR03435 family)